jgi:hypothetical protein
VANEAMTKSPFSRQQLVTSQSFKQDEQKFRISMSWQMKTHMPLEECTGM